jgi:DNA-binding LacI/PurR family transcriptional regulator
MSVGPKRRSVAYFNSELSQEWAALPWAGMVKWALTHDMNLVTLIGDRLGEGKSANAVYDLGRAAESYIFWPGTMTSSIPYDSFLAHLTEKFQKPTVSIQGSIPDAPRIAVGDAAGIESIVAHFVEEHGFSRIGFIGLIPNHAAFDARLEGFKRAMANRGLESPLIVPFIPPERISVVAGIDHIDQAYLKGIVEAAAAKGVQAIIGSCDMVSADTMKAIASLGLRVPGDIAVASFDGFASSGLLTPSLSTINPGWSAIGELAAQAALGLLDSAPSKGAPKAGASKPRARDIEAPFSLIQGQSCGCLSTDALAAGKVLPRRRRLLGRQGSAEIAASTLAASGVEAGGLLAALRADARGRKRRGLFCMNSTPP